MGTNFYLHTGVCPTCGHGAPRHIGKSSGGWCFSLRIYPEEGIHDLPDWERLWAVPGTVIRDEYERDVSVEGMREIITKRWWPERLNHRSDEERRQFFIQNTAVPGPFGLVRHAIDRHCVGHGAGTWDLILGEFS